MIIFDVKIFQERSYDILYSKTIDWTRIFFFEINDYL